MVSSRGSSISPANLFMLDPLADRLYILATLVGLVLRHVIPLWLAVVIVGRDVVLAGALWLLRRRG